MLMDPLVSALNGSQTLISQGLRTLELCVDNLQPDFLYEHIQPVRAELMQVHTCMMLLYTCACHLLNYVIVRPSGGHYIILMML